MTALIAKMTLPVVLDHMRLPGIVNLSQTEMVVVKNTCKSRLFGPSAGAAMHAPWRPVPYPGLGSGCVF